MKKGYEKPGHKWIKRIPTPSGAYKYIYNKLDVNKDKKINRGDLDTYRRRQEVKKKVLDVQKYGRVLTDEERREKEQKQKREQKDYKKYGKPFEVPPYRPDDVSEAGIMKRVAEKRKREIEQKIKEQKKQRLDEIHKKGLEQRMSHVKEEQRTRRRKEKNRKKKMTEYIDNLIGNK